MNAPFNIVVACGSSDVGSRIASGLLRISHVRIAGLTREADEAIQLALLWRPRLVIVDLLLSRGTGLDVLRQLKVRQFRGLVMMTSRSPIPQYRRECTREGADYFFALPGEFDDLEGVIRKLIQKGSS